MVTRREVRERVDAMRKYLTHIHSMTSGNTGLITDPVEPAEVRAIRQLVSELDIRFAELRELMERPE